jgi:HEAT repeat protein
VAQAGDGKAKAVASSKAKAGGDDKSDKSKEHADSKPAAKLDSSKLHSQLRSGDEEQVLEALTAIAENRGTDLAPLVADVLNRGSTLKVLTLAIDTASRIKAPALSESLAPYVRHRDSDLRRAALRALLKTQGPAAAKALRQALHSQDAYIRGTAASGLGSLGAADAVDDLFAALASNVGEAAASIGQLCNAAQCEKLASLLGKTPFDIITGGLEQALFRPASQVPDGTKVKIVVRLRELGTAEARRYLSDVRSRWPEDGSPAVRQALESSVKGQAGVAK